MNQLPMDGVPPATGLSSQEEGPSAAPLKPRSRVPLVMLLVVCLLPVLASYISYYWMPPMGRTNYGTLVEPQRPVTAGMAQRAPAEGPMEVTALDEDGDVLKVQDLVDIKGHWALLAMGAQGCDEVCVRRLYFMRQTQASMGRERTRVAQVLILTDDQPLPEKVREVYPDLIVLRGEREAWLSFLNLKDGEGNADERIGLIDPLGHYMMQFPREPDPKGVRKDLQRLLKASRVG